MAHRTESPVFKKHPEHSLPQVDFLSPAFIALIRRGSVQPDVLATVLGNFFATAASPTELVNAAANLPVVRKTNTRESSLFDPELLGVYNALATKARQQIESWFTAQMEVAREIIGNRPICVYNLGDLHFGHLSTDMDQLIRIRNTILETPRLVCALYGDEIEGIMPRFTSTNVTKSLYDFGQQIRLFREFFLKPLSQSRRILCMVSTYQGHIGWSDSLATIDGWRQLTENLDIPLVSAGGQLILDWTDGKKSASQRLLITHNPGRSSKVDPLAGIREKAREYPTGHPLKPDMAGGAHLHIKSAVGQELEATPPGEPPSGVTLISTGSSKGSTPGLPPDKHLVSHLNKSLADPPGTASIHYLVRRGKRLFPHVYPTATFENASHTFRALTLWDHVQSQSGRQEELIRTIHRRVEAKPRINLLRSETRETPAPHIETSPQKPQRGRQAPQYNRVAWRIISELPIFIEFISQTRFGSSSFTEFRPALKQEVDRLAGEPHSFALLMRHIIDPEVASDINRDELLRAIVKYFSPLTDDRKILGLMLSGSLRTKNWKKSVKDPDDPRIESSPVRPGTFLSNHLNTPLIRHMSTVEIGVGPDADRPNYKITVADHLNWSGSKRSPVMGVSRTYWEDVAERPDVLAGGHVARAGWMTRFDRFNTNTTHPTVVQPGWWSEFDSKGKSNAMYGSPGGQGVILFPDQKRHYATITIEDSIILHQAFLLLAGLDRLDLTRKVLSKSKR